MSGRKNESAVVLNGVLHWETKTYNPSSGEIVFRGDVTYGKTEFKDVPILRLDIKLFNFGCDRHGDSTQAEVYVRDFFYDFIPYLKPVKEFRSVLETELSLIVSRPDLPDVIKAGAERYLKKIGTFSELKSLVRQAKNCVNTLKSGGGDTERIARAILEAMNVMPVTDTEFRKE